jgi:tRNA(adenine34) deaminase
MAMQRVRTSVVVVHNERLLAFKAEDPTSGENYVFLPGGSIEESETAPEAGERETLEETGYVISVDPFRCTDKDYFFHWNGEDNHCLTFFYRGFLKSPMQRPVNDASYHRGVVWIPLDEVRATFSYSEVILEAILELLEGDEA